MKKPVCPSAGWPTVESGHWQLATDGESNKERGQIGWEDYEWAEAGVRKEGKNERERGRGNG